MRNDELKSACLPFSIPHSAFIISLSSCPSLLMISCANALLVQKNALPHFERQQLQDVQAVVLAPRKVFGDDAPHLFGTEEAAPPDRFLRQQLVYERTQRPAQPRAHGG